MSLYPLRRQRLSRRLIRERTWSLSTRSDFIRMFFARSVATFVLAIIMHGDAGAQSAAQGVPNAMQGFSQNRDQPIQIEAASLEMRDKKREATFSGNVKVVQGDTTMSSKIACGVLQFG